MKKSDIILIVSVLIIATLIYIGVTLLKEDGEYVLIKVDGKEYAKLSLLKDTTIDIESKDGHSNKLVIKDGKADIINADCPDKICVNHKSIKYNKETIVCVPNNLIVEIISSSENDIDAIAQ